MASRTEIVRRHDMIISPQDRSRYREKRSGTKETLNKSAFP